MCFFTSEIRQLKLTPLGSAGCFEDNKASILHGVTFAHPSRRAAPRGPQALREVTSSLGRGVLLSEQYNFLSHLALAGWHGDITFYIINPHRSPGPGAGICEGTEKACVPGLDFQGRKSPKGMCLCFDCRQGAQTPSLGKQAPSSLLGAEGEGTEFVTHYERQDRVNG